MAPGFEPDAAELALVAEIVRRLDGLPLAIELAAARLHTHDVAEVAAGLDHRFTLLSAGARTATRHGSLGAAVAWSYELLDDDLRRTFVDLAVFAGPFDAAAAAAICDDRRAGDGRRAGPARRALAGGAHAEPALRAAGDAAGVRRRPAGRARSGSTSCPSGTPAIRWRGSRRRGGGCGEPGEPVLAEIDAAVPELRHALGWLLDHDEVEQAGRLVSGLCDYGFLRLRPDVLAWAEQVAERDPDDRSPFAVARVGRRRVRRVDDRRPGGDRPAHGASRSRRRASPAAIRRPRCRRSRGSNELFLGHLEEAAAWYRQAVATSDDDPLTGLMAAASEVLALGYAGDPSAAAKADALLARVGDEPTPYAAYVWYCAGEADLAVDTTRARQRLAHAVRARRADPRLARRRGRRGVEGVDRRPLRRSGRRRPPTTGG